MFDVKSLLLPDANLFCIEGFQVQFPILNKMTGIPITKLIRTLIGKLISILISKLICKLICKMIGM
jgi:hypothetical protein